jgi:hypothetical protein
MPSATFIARYRPLRVGFLVRQGQSDDVRRAIQLATLIWGGLYDPIIPVPAAGAYGVVDRLVEGFRLDGLCPVVDDPALRQVAQRHRDDVYLFETAIFEGTTPQVADIGMCCEHEARHMRPGDAPLVRVIWPDEIEDALQLSALFGEFAGDEDAAALRRAYDQVGDEAPPDTLLGQERSPGAASAIRFTGLELEPDYLSAPDTIVVVGDGREPDHICAYWNLRAAGHDAFFWSGDEGGLERRRIERHLAGLNVPQMARWHRSLQIAFPEWHGAGQAPIPDGLREAVPSRLDTVVIPAAQLAAFGSEVVPVMEFATVGREVMASVESGDEAERVAIQLPQRPFDADFRFHRVWMVSLTPLQENAYRGTLFPPYMPQLNTWLSRKVALAASVRVEYRGLGVVWEPSRETIDLLPIDQEELLGEILGRAGIRAELSVPGRALPQIIQQLGRIGRARVFAFPGVRELIAHRDAHTGIARQQAENVIADGGSYLRGAVLRVASPTRASTRTLRLSLGATSVPSGPGASLSAVPSAHRARAGSAR